MAATWEIVGLWLLFAATHMGLSSRTLRPKLVARLGEGGFLGVYSLLALAIFVPMVWCYIANRHEEPLLWSLPAALALPWLRWALYVLLGVAFTLVVGGLIQPSPAGMMGDASRVRGIHKITRHPLFMGFGLFGLVHLVWNGWASDLAFFAGFPLFALLGCAHQDRRKLADGDAAYRTWHAETAFLPFGRGAASLRAVAELGPIVIGLGVALTWLLRWLHGPLFGVG